MSRAQRTLTRSRPCAACKQTKDPGEFPLWDDPNAVMRGWALRKWCASCLVGGGHITETRAQKHRQRREVATARIEERADTPEGRVAAHKVAVQLVNRANSDPVFAAALLAAAEQVRVASAA